MAPEGRYRSVSNSGRNFGVQFDAGSGFNLTTLAPLLDDIHQRLAGVAIENLRWQDFVTRYDRPGALFYFDPPYWGSEDDYGKAMFSRDQFAELADRLRQLKGRFVLSINDVPEVRDIFSPFEVESVHLTYTVAGGNNSVSATELIVRGWNWIVMFLMA